MDSWPTVIDRSGGSYGIAGIAYAFQQSPALAHELY